MHHRYRGRAFANARCNALYRVLAHVADGENAGLIRFQEEWRARQRPTSIDPLYRLAGEYVAMLVGRDEVGEPFRARVGADEHEERVGSFATLGSIHDVAQDQALDRTASFYGDYLAVRDDRDVRPRVKLVDEVLRHGF